MKVTLLLFVVFILASCGGSPNPAENNANATIPINTVTPAAVTDTAANKKPNTVKIKPAFNIPALMGKSIDKVRRILGHPSDQSIEPTSDDDEWNNLFTKHGYDLLVNFNPKTREVTDFFIGTLDPTGATDDYSDLIAICNLKENSSNYNIEPVPSIKDNTRYTGIKITEKH